MIIGICGLIGSGKGTVADILVSEHNFQKISFADKLKDAVAVLFEWDRELLEGDSTESRYWREQPDEFWSKETGRTITPRLVLQEFGTDCMRNGFYDGVWVSFLKKKVLDNPNTNFVVPDTRFQNEARVIKDLGGNVWCVKRGPDPMWFRQYVDLGVTPPNDVHISEWDWATIPFDFNIYNEGTLDDLKSQVRGRLASTLRLASVVAAGN